MTNFVKQNKILLNETKLAWHLIPLYIMKRIIPNFFSDLIFQNASFCLYSQEYSDELRLPVFKGHINLGSKNSNHLRRFLVMMWYAILLKWYHDAAQIVQCVMFFHTHTSVCCNCLLWSFPHIGHSQRCEFVTLPFWFAFSVKSSHQAFFSRTSVFSMYFFLYSSNIKKLKNTAYSYTIHKYVK